MSDGEKESLLRDLVLGRLSPEESLRVLDEIEKDPAASSEVDFYAKLVAFCQGDGRDLFAVAARRKENLAEKVARSIARYARGLAAARPVYRFALFAAVLVTAALIGGDRILSNEYDELARVDGVEFHVNVRALAADDIDVAQRLFEGGEYQTALNVLQRHLRVNPSSPLADYVHYASGAILLVEARWKLMGVYPRFDRPMVLRAIEELTEAIQLSSNARLIEEAHWLRAKAFLMLGQVDDCRDELRGLASMGGVRGGAASALLATLGGTK